GRSVSYSDLSVRGNEVAALLRLSEEDLIEVLSLDLNRNGRIDPHEIEESRSLLTDYLRNNFSLQARDEEGGKVRLHPCPPKLEKIEPPAAGDERRRFRVHLLFRCQAPVVDLAIRCTIFQSGGFSHEHQATARLGGTERVLFFNARNQEETVVVPLATQVGRY